MHLSNRRKIALVCLAWIAVVGLFNLYWAPEDSQFWVGLVPPLIVALSLAYQDLAQTLTSREELLNGVFVFGIAAVFVINSITAIVPRSDAASNEGLSKALCLGQSSSPEDLFITPGWDWASGYGPYFARRQVLSIVDSYLLQAGSNRTTLFRLIDERIAATMARGGRVYVVRLFSLDENDSNWLKRTTGLVSDDFTFKRKLAWTCGGEVVWEVVKQ